MIVDIDKLKTKLINEKFLRSSKWKCITLEPSYILYVMTSVLCNFYYQNLLIKKTCQTNSENEINTNTICDDEKAGLTFIAFANSWIYPPTSWCGAVCTIFAIIWSDKVGKRRRPLLLIPICGLALQSALACVYSGFWNFSAPSILIIQCLVRIFSGGSTIFFLTTELYITDTTSQENYTERFSSFLLIDDVSVPIQKEQNIWNIIKSENITDSLKIIFKKRYIQVDRIIFITMCVALVTIGILQTVPLIDMWFDASHAITRSEVSKIIDEDEHGICVLILYLFLFKR
ncbi:hypothetical protein PGB90_010502 [Kerria lacca]